MKKIQLHGKHGKGKVVLVDDEDYGLISLFNWNVIRDHGVYRCLTHLHICGKTISIYMSRLVMNAPKGTIIDHANCNGLDNQRQNLRVCTNQQNNMNRRSNKNTSSKYKGVSWDKTKKAWTAQIVYNNKFYRLGSFYEEKAAAQAYDIKARELFGEFAYYNGVGVNQQLNLASEN